MIPIRSFYCKFRHCQKLKTMGFPANIIALTFLNPFRHAISVYCFCCLLLLWTHPALLLHTCASVCHTMNLGLQRARVPSFLNLWNKSHERKLPTEKMAMLCSTQYWLSHWYIMGWKMRTVGQCTVQTALRTHSQIHATVNRML